MSKLSRFVSGWWSQLSFRQALCLMLCVGALNIFSFAPIGMWPVQIAGMALLFALLSQHQVNSVLRRAAWLAWAYSFSWIFSCTSWLLIAMVRYGDLPIPLAVAALALLSAGLAMYAALSVWFALWLQRRWRISNDKLVLIILPALWMLNEWLRGWVLTGFPWSISGYALSNTMLAAFAPILGVYGLSFLSAVLSGIFSWIIISRFKKQRLVLGSIAFALIFGAGALLKNVHWTQATGKPISVRLLQGNVEQDMKFDPAYLNASLELYRKMLTAAPADLIVTPETAFPLLTSMLPQDFLPRLNAYAQETHSALMLGVVVQDGEARYTNSLLGFSPLHADRAYRYDKHHLVPFGEFVPFGFRWFVHMMNIPLSELSVPDQMQSPMAVRDQFVMPDICYESLFGEEIAAQLSHQIASHLPVATILLNASNLAWYGNSFAMPQHLQFAQMRVLETGRPWLGVTNTGSTVVINADSSLKAQVPHLTRATLESSVQGYSGTTPYIFWGNRGILGLVFFILLTTCGLSQRAARKSHN
ncbi:apolipoprotein N-acyltransferase [Undibacterium sp. Dicai25W]|uniref:apolipoprotein N-acyltransferase n=1 Tax=Undibacterium sp. Dicai25W TaxID=3413034 RepID=UPI003BF0060E